MKAVGKIKKKKAKRGSNIIILIILRLLGRIASGIEGKGTENSGGKNKL